jgi:predicted SnoaL-like aldol condensation-catalyzing enzyme
MNRSSDGKTGSRERTPEAIKKVVMAFYDAAINRRDFAGATQFIGGRYVQHNPLIADGLDGFMACARGSAIVDIFKLEGGKIFEHWDVIQPIPEKALNQNGMF